MKKSEKAGKISTDDLAIMIAKGFKSVEGKVVAVDERLTSVRDELLRKLDGTNARIDDLALHRVKYEDFDLLKKDVGVLKKKFESEHSHGR